MRGLALCVLFESTKIGVSFQNDEVITYFTDTKCMFEIVREFAAPQGMEWSLRILS